MRIILIIACLLLGGWTFDAGNGQNVRNLHADGAAVNPQFSVNMKADSVRLRNPFDGSTVTINDTGIVNAQMLTTLPPWTEGYVYFIYGNGPGLGGAVSNNDPTVGPALPPGYTHYSYAYSVRINGSGAMPTGLEVRGHKVSFTTFPNTTVCAGGCPTTSAWTLAYWQSVPTNALEICGWWDAEVNANGSPGSSNVAWVMFGVAPFQFFTVPSTTTVINSTVCREVDSSSLSFQWQFYGDFSHVASTFFGYQLLNYTVPNGD